MSIGVIIGRFQSSQLHAGYTSLLNSVQSKVDHVLILLGCPSGGPSKRNPLDFRTRSQMINQFKFFKTYTILPLFDMPKDEDWSKQIDSILHRLFPYEECYLYFSRDSSMDSYTGKYSKVFIDPAYPLASSTNDREEKGRSPIASNDFRAGVIYSEYNRFPSMYCTVDYGLLIPEDTFTILLGYKKSLKQWVLPGGFVNPGEDLAVAAVRELVEETGLIPSGGAEGSKLLWAGSVDDWRTKRNGINIVTHLYTGFYDFGRIECKDDLDEAKWFDIEDARDVISKNHAPLLEKIIEYREE